MKPPWVAVLKQWDFSGMKCFKMMDRVWMRFYIIPILINISWRINTSRCYMPACILLSKWHMWQVQWRCLEQSAGIHNKWQSIAHLHRPKTYLNHLLILNCQESVPGFVQTPNTLQWWPLSQSNFHLSNNQQELGYRWGCSKKHSGLDMAC